MKYMINKKQILIGVILLIGLAAIIVFSQRQQSVRSKASIDASKAFTIKDDQENPIECASDNFCKTKRLKIKIKVNKEQLNNFLSP